MNEKKQPKVSVIIPCYNHEKFIKTAITSVLNQTYKDYEVIVADNGSTDRSGEIIKSFEDSVRIITLKENNPILCQKLLWEAARGEYMAELCSDDYWYPEKLEKQVKAAEEHKEFQIFFTWAVITAEDLEEITDDRRFAQTNRSRYKWIETMFHKGTVFELSSIMIKNDGRFERYYKDVSVFRQMPDTKLYLNMAFGEEIYMVEEYLVKHRMHGNNVSSPNMRVTARALNENMFLIRDIWERLKGEEFLRAFDEGNLAVVGNEAEITAEKIALLLKFAQENEEYINLYSDAAIDYMLRHYHDEGVSEILEVKYGISLEQAWQYSGESGTGKLILDNMNMINSLCKSEVKHANDLIGSQFREMAEGIYKCYIMILENADKRGLRQEFAKAVETSLDVARELCLNDLEFDAISLEQIEKCRSMLCDIDDDDIWKELMEMIALISHRLEEYNCRRRVYGTAGENETAEFKGGINYLIVMPILTEIFDQSYTFPIGMAYVSSSLKRTGRNVITYNLNYKSGSIEDNLRGVILDNEIDVIATGGLTAQYWQLERILQAARRVKPDIITWVGGGIITSDPVNAMDALEIADYGMIGEGEITICELADAVEGIRDPHDVAGLIFREHGKWVVTAQRKEIEDLDALPYPDYEGFEYDKVLDKIPTDIYALNQGRFGFVSFGRSCPFNCTFCFHPSGTKYRKRSMDSVFDEIDYLVEHYGIRNVAVTDELFVRKIEDVVEFCRRIRERNIGFVISLRVDMVNREMLTLLKESGCLSIGFGLESADDRVLKSMKKNITVKQIDEALGMCREIGINCNGNFIFGDQEETVETARNTIDYWKTHPEYQIAMHLIVLYPGSELYKLAVARGIIKDPVQFIKDGCPYVNISKMTDQEYRDTALEISMLSKGRTEFLKETSIEYLGFGKTNLTARCPRCGRINVWNGLDVFRSLGNVICDSCDKVMSILVSDYIGNAAEENYRKLKGHKIAIWPMTNAVAEFVDKVPSALGENTFFIDRAEVKQGARFKGKVVYAPSVIDEVRIDTVFVSVTTSIATEIIDDLQSRPSVRNIFFLGDLIKKDFSVG